MPIQAPQWTEFLSCPVCCNEFAANLRPPISLGCGHTICRTCLATLHHRQCPFDQTVISTDLDYLPINNALLQLVSTPGISSSSTVNASPTTNNNAPNTSASITDPDLNSTSVQSLSPENLQYYKTAKACIEELALYLKPCPAAGSGSLAADRGGSSSIVSTSGPSGASLLSRQMQRKLVILVNCQLIEDEGRARSLRAARSLGERTVMELILHHQNPQQLSTNLWAAVRARGCQFLGPAMQEEVLKLVLLALEDGSALSRKVLVMFVVQRLEPHFSQASKTSIGHVVQLLYRASCFKVSKREGDSSLMQLKEEFRTYEALRREHDAQIVQIATEAGLRIAPDQWSSLLYGDTAHKSHMQSINDKLQTPQSFVQSVQELIIALQRTGDPANLSGLRVQLKHLAAIDWNSENHVPSWAECAAALQAVKRVVAGLVDFVQHHGNRKLQEAGHLAHNRNYKISLCRDLNNRGTCPRGPNCTFAHSDEELEKYRTKLRKSHGSSATASLRMMSNGKDHHPVGAGTMSATGPGQPGGVSRGPRSAVDYHAHPGGSNGDGASGGSMHQSSSSSHGYHSSGEEASSPVRYQKTSSAGVGGGGGGGGGTGREGSQHSHRMLDKNHVGSQGSGLGSGAAGGPGANGPGGGPHPSSFSGGGPVSMNGGPRGVYPSGGGSSSSHYQHAGAAGGTSGMGYSNRGSSHHATGGPGGGSSSQGGGAQQHNSPQGMRFRPPPHMGPSPGGANANGGANYHPGPGGPGGSLPPHPSMHHERDGGHLPAAYPQQLPATQPAAGGHMSGAHQIESHLHHSPLANAMHHPPYYGAAGEYPEGKHGAEHGPMHGLPHHHGHNHPSQIRRPPNYAAWDNLASPPHHHLRGEHHGTPSGKIGPSSHQAQQQQAGSFGMTGHAGQPPHPSSGSVPYGPAASPKNGHSSNSAAPMGSKYMGGIPHQAGQQNYHHQKLGPQGRDYKEKHQGNRGPHPVPPPPHVHGGLPSISSVGPPPYPAGRNGPLPPQPYLSSPLPMAGPDAVGKNPPQGQVGPPPPPHHNGYNGSQAAAYQHNLQQQQHQHHHHAHHMHHGPGAGYQPQRQTAGGEPPSPYLSKMLFESLGTTGGGNKKSYNQQLMNQHLNEIGMANPAAAAAAAGKDMFIRSDSLLADDDALLVAEQEFNNAAQYGPISRMNPIGTERIDLGLTPRSHPRQQQRGGLWSTTSSSSLGDNPSPTGGGNGSSSASSPFYAGSGGSNTQPLNPPTTIPPTQKHSMQQQVQSHLPYHPQHPSLPHPSSTGALDKMAPEPNNNSIDFDLLRVGEKKTLEYDSAVTMADCCETVPTSAGGSVVEQDFLLQSLVSQTGLGGGGHYGAQQQHPFHTVMMMSTDRSGSPQHAQQHQLQHPQQQLLSKDRCNGGGGPALSPACANDDLRKLNDMKSPPSSLSGVQSPAMLMSVTSESSVCTPPPTVGMSGGGSNGGTSSMWNNLLDLSTFKPPSDAMNNPNDPDGHFNPAGRTNGTAGYPMSAFPSASSTFIRSSADQYKLPKLLMDSSATGGGQQQQQQPSFLAQSGKSAAAGGAAVDTLGDVARFHDMINTSQPASPSCLSDRVNGEDQRKLNAFKELNELRIQSGMLTSVTASPSPSVVTSTVGSSDGAISLHVDQTATSLWNNLLDLPSLKPSPLSALSSVGGVGLEPTTAGPSGEPLITGSSSSSQLSALLNSSNGSSSEDSYEAGMADDIRELEMRLVSSVLQNDENGI
uniref:RING-type E3 ubiquitin transferase n=1 Tax=Anopheles stephensi TaxID=30069 RepID=A0A182YEK3_ANOST